MNRVDEHLAFGFIKSGTRNLRMFYISARKGYTTIPYLADFGNEKSTIHTD